MPNKEMNNREKKCICQVCKFQGEVGCPRADAEEEVMKLKLEKEQVERELEEAKKNAEWKRGKLEYKLKRYEEIYLADCDKGLLHKILKLQSQLSALREYCTLTFGESHPEIKKQSNSQLLFKLQDELPVESEVGVASDLRLGITIVIDYVKKLQSQLSALRGKVDDSK